MISVGLKPLVEKLNAPTRRALEGAAGLCLSRSHYNVEIEHWLLKLIEAPSSDVPLLLKHFDVDASRFSASLTRVLDRLKTGNARAPSLAPSVVDLVRDAWLAASVDFGEGGVRSGHLLYTLLASDELSRSAAASLSELEGIDAAALKRDFHEALARSVENGEQREAGGGSTAAPGRPTGGPAGQSLGQFTIDLTERARKGEIDPVLGRDSEIRQLVDILCRRRQNNPILTGEAGVGKTAVAEGFARRLAEGDVPPSLRDVSLLTLDLGLLQAGAGVKGEFENRLKSVIEEVKASPKPIILFIDEAHTLIGAGGQAGQGDAANLLKPALARGELRTIAATTWAEYKKYFERDAALARRFQVVKVEEPGEAAAVEIMRGLADTMRSHHGVRVLDEAVQDSVKLSTRYISGRQLPDKSVSVLDTACARVAIGLSSTPPAVEDLSRRIGQLDTAIRSLAREAESGTDHTAALEELRAERTEAADGLGALERRWEKEKDLVAKIQELQDRVEGVKEDDEASEPLDKDAAITELNALKGELSELQGEEPLLHPHVDSQAIAEVVAAWTGIPVGRMVTNEIEAVISLRDRMEERVVGQTHALEQIAQRVRTGRAGLTDPKRPIGVFMLAGPSGVGKTETAITLAELLYGGEQNMTVINMSEYKEEHKVSLLMGSPPGYVGYGEGGVLTEAVRRKPYSVVLLDEMEKAAVGVQDVFYQVFDKGSLTDGEGRNIDFRNTIILMTSNLGTDKIVSLCADPETMPDAEGLGKAIRPDLLEYFKPAFLGRLNVIPYFPLDDATMKMIVKLQLGRIISRVRQHYGAELTYTDQVVETIAARCTEVHTGARNVDHIVSRTLLPELAAEFLSAMASDQPIGTVEIDVADGSFAYRLS